MDNKPKTPSNWRREGKSNPYDTYYKLVKIFGKPDMMDTNKDGAAIWDEDNLSDHDLVKGDKIIRIELRDEPSNFIHVIFRNPNKKEVEVKTEDLNSIITGTAN